MNSVFLTGIPTFIGPKRMTWKVAWSPGSNHSLSEDFIAEILMAIPVFLLMFPLAVSVFLLTEVQRWCLVSLRLDVASISWCHHLPHGPVGAAANDASLLVCGKVCFVSPLYFAWLLLFCLTNFSCFVSVLQEQLFSTLSPVQAEAYFYLSWERGTSCPGESWWACRWQGVGFKAEGAALLRRGLFRSSYPSYIPSLNSLASCRWPSPWTLGLLGALAPSRVFYFLSVLWSRKERGMVLLAG